MRSDILSKVTDWEVDEKKAHKITFRGNLKDVQISYEVQAKIGIFGDITAEETILTRESWCDDWVIFWSNTIQLDDMKDLASRVMAIKMEADERVESYQSRTRRLTNKMLEE
jgi:hypothetical protein